MDRVEAHVIVFFPQYLRIHCPVAKENKELMNFIAPGDNLTDVDMATED